MGGEGEGEVGGEGEGEAEGGQQPPQPQAGGNPGGSGIAGQGSGPRQWYAERL